VGGGGGGGGRGGEAPVSAYERYANQQIAKGSKIEEGGSSAG